MTATKEEKDFDDKVHAHCNKEIDRLKRNAKLSIELRDAKIAWLKNQINEFKSVIGVDSVDGHKCVRVEAYMDLSAKLAVLRNEIARLNGQTGWKCVCGGTDCEGQKENVKLRSDNVKKNKQIKTLDKAIARVLNDAAYKAPEQIGEVAQRWIDILEKARETGE